MTSYSLTDVIGSQSNITVLAEIQSADSTPPVCYKLRSYKSGSDKSTTEYVKYPVLPQVCSHEEFSLDFIQETLNYFVLSGQRLSDMTRAYDDTSSYCRLLEEKERDLELAARIGQQLLDRNRSLNEQLIARETELQHALSRVMQLRRDVSSQSELIDLIKSNEDEDFDTGNVDTSFILGCHGNMDSDCHGNQDNSRHDNSDDLSYISNSMGGTQQVFSRLGSENRLLKEECARLLERVESSEQHELYLTSNITEQLSEAKQLVTDMSAEISSRSEENIRNQEQITKILSQLIETQSRVRKLSRENEELRSYAQEGQQTVEELVYELAGMKQQYDELHVRYRSVLDTQTVSSYCVDALSTLPAECATDRAEYNTLGAELAALRHLYSSVSKDYPVFFEPFYSDISSTVCCLSSCVPSVSLTDTADFLHFPSDPAGAAGDSGIWSKDFLSETSDFSTGFITDDSDSNYLHPIDAEHITTHAVSRTNRAAPVQPVVCSLLTQADDTAQFPDQPSRKQYHLEQKHLSKLSDPCFSNRIQIMKAVEGSNQMRRWAELARPHFGQLLQTQPGINRADLITHTEVCSEGGVSSSLCPPQSVYGGVTDTVFTLTNSTVKHPLTSGITSAVISGVTSGVTSGIISYITSGVTSGITSDLTFGVNSGVTSCSVSGLTFGAHYTSVTCLNDRGTSLAAYSHSLQCVPDTPQVTHCTSSVVCAPCHSSSLTVYSCLTPPSSLVSAGGYLWSFDPMKHLCRFGNLFSRQGRLHARTNMSRARSKSSIPTQQNISVGGQAQLSHNMRSTTSGNIGVSLSGNRSVCHLSPPPHQSTIQHQYGRQGLLSSLMSSTLLTSSRHVHSSPGLSSGILLRAHISSKRRLPDFVVMRSSKSLSHCSPDISIVCGTVSMHLCGRKGGYK